MKRLFRRRADCFRVVCFLLQLFSFVLSLALSFVEHAKSQCQAVLSGKCHGCVVETPSMTFLRRRYVLRWIMTFFPPS